MSKLLIRRFLFPEGARPAQIHRRMTYVSWYLQQVYNAALQRARLKWAISPPGQYDYTSSMVQFVIHQPEVQYYHLAYVLWLHMVQCWEVGDTWPDGYNGMKRPPKETVVNFLWAVVQHAPYKSEAQLFNIAT